MNILVHAYQVSPFRGSEFSVAWNYVVNMSKNHNLYVICGQSSYSMGDFSDLEAYLRGNAMSNVQFFMIKPSKWVHLLNLHHPISFTSPTFYLAYKQWEKEVYRFLLHERELMDRIDVIHYLGPIGYREPAYLWKFNKPYIWGPVGGLENMKAVFISRFMLESKLKYLVKNAVNYMQLRCHSRVKSAMRRADVILACNTGQQRAVIKYFKRGDVGYLPENKITKIPFLENHEEYINKKYEGLAAGEGRFLILWIGTLIERKMPFMLLDIADRIKGSADILMMGDGHLKGKLAAQIENRGLASRVKLTGNLPREQVFSFLEQAHLHVLTSAMEANTTVVLEAFSLFTPTVTLNHCGMADTVTDSCGIKISIGSYGKMVADFADSINYLIDNPARLKELSFGCVARARELAWDRQAAFWEKCYETAKQKHIEKQPTPP